MTAYTFDGYRGYDSSGERVVAVHLILVEKLPEGPRVSW